ncbi:MAG: response regulator transcription factor [Pseudomonadota bacterium]
MNFSSVFERILQTEFSETNLIRVDSALPSAEAEPAGTDNLRLVLVDEALIDDLLARVDDYHALAGAAQLAVAYQTPANARRLLAARLKEPALNGISLLPLNCPVEIWLSAMRILLHGNPFLPAELLLEIGKERAARPCEAARGQTDAPAAETAPAPATASTVAPTDLTRRELQILALVADGKRNKEIAADLCLSEHTVKLHIHHAIRKLGVDNRTAAARWYISSQGSAPTGAFVEPTGPQ